jgi:hypothetical protein
MDTMNFNKESLAFNKSAVKMGFDALNTITGQAAVASDFLMGVIPSVPEEGKKVVSILFKDGQKVLDSMKTQVERSLELDWTAKNAPVKNLEVMEILCKDAFTQVEEFKKETKALVEKASKPLPKEVKSIVDTWNDSFNTGMEFFQNCVFKNFEMAKKAMTDVSVFTPSVEPKAAK